MRDAVLSVVALVFLTGFLLVLFFEVPRFDLGGVILLTLILAAYDFYRLARERGRQQ